MKRTPLARGKALLRRTPLARGSKRLQPRRLEQSEAERRWAIRQAVYRRDGGQCLLAGRTGRECWPAPAFLTPHHLRKSAHGGPYSRSNLVALCIAHQHFVEDEPHVAHGMGLVIRAGESTGDAWRRMAAAGLVTYGPWGEPLQSAKLPGDPRR